MKLFSFRAGMSGERSSCVTANSPKTEERAVPQGTWPREGRIPWSVLDECARAKPPFAPLVSAACSERGSALGASRCSRRSVCVPASSPRFVGRAPEPPRELVTMSLACGIVRDTQRASTSCGALANVGRLLLEGVIGLGPARRSESNSLAVIVKAPGEHLLLRHCVRKGARSSPSESGKLAEAGGALDAVEIGELLQAQNMLNSLDRARDALSPWAGSSAAAPAARAPQSQNSNASGATAPENAAVMSRARMRSRASARGEWRPLRLCPRTTCSAAIILACSSQRRRLALDARPHLGGPEDRQQHVAADLHLVAVQHLGVAARSSCRDRAHRRCRRPTCRPAAS